MIDPGMRGRVSAMIHQAKRQALCQEKAELLPMLLGNWALLRLLSKVEPKKVEPKKGNVLDQLFMLLIRCAKRPLQKHKQQI